MSESSQTPRTLGDIQLFREAGRGQMAIVYEAHQISLNRKVATKILPYALTQKEHFLLAFKQECRITASLHHGNIVPAFGVGYFNGVHYIVMKFIEGRTIDKFVEDKPSDSTTFQLLARLFVQATGALDHAHQFGVVHRDIEPGNLLIDNDQKPWLIDWGLAQFRDCQALSMASGALGNLDFMSPELILREGLVDQRTDIYALGAVLYGLLTPKPATRDQSRDEMLQEIASQEYQGFCEKSKEIRLDLEKIALKAMAKDPAKRYHSAEEMGDALRQFVN
jgi:serine/threonine protein kinase